MPLVCEANGLYIISMKVYEFLRDVSEKDIKSALQEEYNLEDDAAQRLLNERANIVNAIQVKEDVVALRVAKETDLDDSERWDVSGVLDDGEIVGIETTPWGVLNHLEVNASPELTQAQIAAHILYELTFVGNDEEKREQVMKLHDIYDAGEFSDLAPGIKISPQVMAAMQADPELKKLLEGLTFDDVKNKGRRVRDD